MDLKIDGKLSVGGEPVEMEAFRKIEVALVCRICLNKRANMISIFESHRESRIRERVYFCTNTALNEGSNLPCNICPDCFSELNVSCKFKQKCLDSEKILEEYAAVVKSEDDASKVQESDVINLSMSDSTRTNATESPPKDSIKIKALNNMSVSRKKYKCCTKVQKTKRLERIARKKYDTDPLSVKMNETISSIVGESTKNACKTVTKDCNEKVNKKCDNERYRCEACNILYPNRWVFKVHMRTHSGDKPYQCDQCGKRFITNSNLRMHKRLTHNGERQVCSECGKSFSCLTYLKRHLVIHYAVKPHACTICNKRFSTKTYLKEHLARHRGERKFFCEICASKFVSDVNLKQHMAIHGIQAREFKKHQCTFCDYKTMGRVDLARHIRKHTGEKPFHCPHDGCQSAFAAKASLKLHIRTHTGEKPYVCTECSARFARSDKLKTHMLKKHNIVTVPANKRSRLMIEGLSSNN